MKLIDPTKILIDRENRQRREITITPDFLASIERRGIINPIIIDGLKLIAGERRLTAALQLNLPLVPTRQLSDLGSAEAELIELEENIQRSDLPWQDKVRAVQRMYDLYLVDHPNAPHSEFAASIGYSHDTVSNLLAVAKELHRPAVAQAPTLTKAKNIVVRSENREKANILADLIDAVGAPETTTEEPPVQEGPPPPERDLYLADFTLWAPAYKGQKFNLLHCDFPYGIDLDQSDQVQAQSPERLQSYEDSEDTYWKLLQALADNASNLLSSSAHVIFWFSMKHYSATLDFFEHHLPFIELDEFPLIWLKSDNKGIAPDVQRRPRRIYETALFGCIGDRKILRLVSNGYSAPKANSSHMSEKPEPVLRHFLSMVCDSQSRLLDPTCGSGSSIRAAESLGCQRAIGLEIDPQFHADAMQKLKLARGLRFLSESAHANG